MVEIASNGPINCNKYNSSSWYPSSYYANKESTGSRKKTLMYQEYLSDQDKSSHHHEKLDQHQNYQINERDRDGRYHQERQYFLYPLRDKMEYRKYLDDRDYRDNKQDKSDNHHHKKGRDSDKHHHSKAATAIDITTARAVPVTRTTTTRAATVKNIQQQIRRAR